MQPPALPTTTWVIAKRAAGCGRITDDGCYHAPTIQGATHRASDHVKTETARAVCFTASVGLPALYDQSAARAVLYLDRREYFNKISIKHQLGVYGDNMSNQSMPHRSGF